MKNTALVLLVVVNALLLLSLINRSTPGAGLSSVAHAQNRAPRPGDYLMIPGEVTGGSSSVVYVIDTTNGWLGAFAYDDAVKRVEAMPNKIDLAQVFSQGAAANEPKEKDPKDRRRN